MFALGLDDVRGVQDRSNDERVTPTTVHCSRECLAILVKRFDYLTRGVDAKLLEEPVRGSDAPELGEEVRRKIQHMTDGIMEWFPNAPMGDLGAPKPSASNGCSGFPDGQHQSHGHTGSLSSGHETELKECNGSAHEPVKPEVRQW